MEEIASVRLQRNQTRQKLETLSSSPIRPVEPSNTASDEVISTSASVANILSAIDQQVMVDDVTIASSIVSPSMPSFTSTVNDTTAKRMITQPPGSLSRLSQTKISKLTSEARTKADLLSVWKLLQQGQQNDVEYGYTTSNDDGAIYPAVYNAININKLMTKALDLELPTVAIEIFESAFGFQSSESVNSMRSDRPSASDSDAINLNQVSKQSLQPNNFICTTAIKAYGRVQKISAALQVFKWFENLNAKISQSSDSTQNMDNKADVYMLTALLYVCAKTPNKNPRSDFYYKQAEKIFFEEFPKRNISVSIAAVNSLMYMYARNNNPDEVSDLQS